jgi:hypothetical protein
VFKLANADGWVNRNAKSWVTYFFIIFPDFYSQNAESFLHSTFIAIC